MGVIPVRNVLQPQVAVQRRVVALLRVAELEVLSQIQPAALIRIRQQERVLWYVNRSPGSRCREVRLTLVFCASAPLGFMHFSWPSAFAGSAAFCDEHLLRRSFPGVTAHAAAFWDQPGLTDANRKHLVVPNPVVDGVLPDGTGLDLRQCLVPLEVVRQQVLEVLCQCNLQCRGAANPIQNPPQQERDNEGRCGGVVHSCTPKGAPQTFV